jgi:outer membrane protein assembly factor BamB
LGPFQDEFGSSSSPALIEGKLLINEDHDINSFLLCLDPATGATVWKTPRDGATRSYSTPVAWRPGNETQVVVAGALELTGYRLSDGAKLWSTDGLARIVNTTPAVVGKRLFVATWSPGGDTTARIAMEPWSVARDSWDKDHNGKLTRQEVDNKEVLERFFRIDLNQDQGLDEQEWNKYAQVFERAQNALLTMDPESSDARARPKVQWEYRKGLPYVPSPLVYRGVVYLVKTGGIVTTLDAATGELFKQARARGAGDYYSSPVAGDGKVYLVSEPGMISVLRAAPKWEVIATHDLSERTTSSPVIDGSRIFFRTEKALYCFRLPKEVSAVTR